MVKVTCKAAGQAKADAWIVGVDKDRKAPGLKAFGLEKEPLVRRVVEDKAVSLGFRSVRVLPLEERWVVLVGLGDVGKLTQEKVGALANAACRAAAQVGAKRAATTLHGECGLAAAEGVQAVVHGVVIGGLDLDQYKGRRDGGEQEPKARLDSLVLALSGRKGDAALQRTASEAAVVAEAVNDARLLANTPANIATPEWLAQEARRRGRAHGFKVSVKGRAALRREGFNALCGVAQGSVNEERLITMDYHPPGAKKTLVVVGKGVCFDTGGISIKPSQGMWDMKYDKCGACNTIALMATLKALKVKHRVVGVVAAVENMVSGTAQRPGDIVTAKDGTTIEVLNTDAEGRLILADAIAYARSFKPAWMVDLATLTGACDYAVGSTYVAVMANEDGFARSLVESSLRAGDKSWHLPQGEEFDEANKGTYADLQNISTTNKAGTCIGGSFLKHFAKDTTWAHLDIASKAWTGSPVDYFPKGPTGAGLRIVLQRIRDE